jgi:hypothetical protein
VYDLAPRLRSARAPLLLAGAVAGALAAGILVGLFTFRGGDSVATFPTTPVVASAGGLRAFADALAHPVYWAGPLPSYTYELRLTSQGRVFVRYLPAGVEPGDPNASYLTVATYPVTGAVAALRRAAARGGVGAETRGGFAYYDPARPRSAYYARRDAPGYEVEVFDPTPGHARSLVLAGRIQPVP